MTLDEKRKVLIELLTMGQENGGNRITSELLNGFSERMGRFMDTLLVADTPPVPDNVGQVKGDSPQE